MASPREGGRYARQVGAVALLLGLAACGAGGGAPDAGEPSPDGEPAPDGSAGQADAVRPDASPCALEARWCEGACASCPAGAAETACAGAACEAVACEEGLQPCAGRCVSEDAVCRCEATPRPAATEWMTWAPTPVSPSEAAYAVDADVVLDLATCRMWQRAVSATPLGWQDASDACEALGLGGYTDWRLPTAIELKSILDRARHAPAINVTAFPDTPATAEANWYWTSTLVVRDPTYAWAIGFLNGVSTPADRGGGNLVRCVR